MNGEKRQLPYDAITGKELEPVETPGYYPGFSTLAQQKYWDAATRKAVEDRVHRVPEIRFFTASEAGLMEAVTGCLLPQDDRTADRRIPIVPWIDQRLFRNELSGFQYEDMPPDPVAYQWGLQAIAAMCRQRFSVAFEDATRHQQELILQSIHDEKPEPLHANWERMNVKRWWAMVMEDVVTVYYAHPWAWDEIGFGGPAYPRAYMRLENGLPEPWEKDEQRYAWSAPTDSLSGSGAAEEKQLTHLGGKEGQ